MVPRSWYQDPGTKILVPRSWYQDLGTKILVPRSWYQDPGTKILVPRSWYQNLWGNRSLGDGGTVLSPDPNRYPFFIVRTPQASLVGEKLSGECESGGGQACRKLQKREHVCPSKLRKTEARAHVLCDILHVAGSFKNRWMQIMMLRLCLENYSQDLAWRSPGFMSVASSLPNAVQVVTVHVPWSNFRGDMN